MKTLKWLWWEFKMGLPWTAFMIITFIVMFVLMPIGMHQYDKFVDDCESRTCEHGFARVIEVSGRRECTCVQVPVQSSVDP